MKKNKNNLSDIEMDLLEAQACEKIGEDKTFNDLYAEHLGIRENIKCDVSYYKEAELELSKKINAKNNLNIKEEKPLLNRYERKNITKRKLCFLKNSSHYPVIKEKKRENPGNNKGDSFLKRSYPDNAKFHKKLSNKQVRKNSEFTLKGNSYKKVYNYNW